MQRPPPIREAAKFPATSLVCLGAIGVTLAFWNHWDITPLVMNESALGREPWRLVTSALPHVGPAHLFFNLYWVWVFGTLVERTFGSLRLLGAVVLLAAASSAAEWALFQGGVGLSGVGYGLFGMLWALRRRAGFENVVDQRTVSLFVVWFFICIVTTWVGIMNVGNVAHGAGAAVGYLLGMCVAAEGRQRQARAAVLAAVLVMVGGAASVGRPWINFYGHSTAGLISKGYEALKAGRNEEAAEVLGRVTQADPANARAWYNYGVALERLDRKSEAFNAFVEAARLEPIPEHRKAAAEYGAYLASLELEEHDTKDARGILKRAMDVAPEDTQLWLWSGMERWDSGDRPGAIAAYEKALSIDPANEEAKKHLEYAKSHQP